MYIKLFISGLPENLRRPMMGIISGMEVFECIIRNKPVPLPHSKKVEIISDYSKKFSTQILIETGTYLGQTVDDLKNVFSKIYSIELDTILYKNAKKIFSENKNVKIFHGDSASVLSKIKNGKPVLYWLDAHYSGGITAKGPKNTPILKELTLISKNLTKGSVILIDDAREFTGVNDYPTIKEIKLFVSKHFLNYKIEIKDDIIRIYPK